MHLGPVISTKVELEGSTTDALLDTGSPATIVSLEFLMKALWKQKPAEQPREEWDGYFKKWIEPPDVTLQNYEGDRINTVGQVRVTISRGVHSHEAVIQVQRHGPFPLLIGTNLQAKLGFMFLQTNPDGTAVNLLNQQEVQIKTEATTADAVVHLVQPVHLPANHGKLLKVKLEGDYSGKTTLFESAQKDLVRQGLIIEDGLVTPDKDGHFILHVQNHYMSPVNVTPSQVLGHLASATIECTSGEPNSTDVKGISLHTTDQKRVEGINGMLGIQELNLEPEEKLQISELICEYADVFALNQSELGHTDFIHLSIDTGDSPPLRQPVRRIPFALSAKVEEMVEEIEEQGVVQPSASPWTSPVVLVAKKDGSTRLCVDYRRLNSVTRKDVYPLPRIDDTLDSLAQQKYFTTLDLASGYWQINMDPQSQEKTAFITHSGLYEFCVMLFGLCNAPATFRRLM